MKAIRIHEEGGPEVLRYEEVPDPEPGFGEVLVELRAASLNHLDLWVRKGLPSVPKPRILGADGAGVIAGTNERVVINPGLAHAGSIQVLGEHRDGARTPSSSLCPAAPSTRSRRGCRSRRRRRSRSSSRPPTGCS